MPGQIHTDGVLRPTRTSGGLLRVGAILALVGGLCLTFSDMPRAQTLSTDTAAQTAPADALPAEHAGQVRLSTVASKESTAPPSLATTTEPPKATAKPEPHDLSPMGMFLNADPVVKAVMVLLAAASVVTWTILLVKMFSLGLAKWRLRKSLDQIHQASSLRGALERVRCGLALRLLAETEEELALSHGLSSEGIKERAAIALQRIEVTVGKRMAAGTGILATIGSIGPFVGLFGTVWGIMRSFIGIANSNTTNLAVVAPGIAEALLATGIGLVAAIPAVVIYNALTRSITGYRAMTGDAVALIMRHLSRDLDRREIGGGTSLRLVGE